jgi:phage terminase large subunit-like protein
MKAKDGSDPHYLVQALAEIDEGEEIVLEMKKAGVKSYIEVTRVSTGERHAVEDDEEDKEEGDELVDGLKTIHAD